MGGLLNPEAFITATRQAAAQSHGWSLENLRLQAEAIALKDPNDKQSTNAQPDTDGYFLFLSSFPLLFSSLIIICRFTLRGLSLEGASWAKGALALTDELSVSLAPIRFIWRNQVCLPLPSPLPSPSFYSSPSPSLPSPLLVSPLLLSLSPTITGGHEVHSGGWDRRHCPHLRTSLLIGDPIGAALRHRSRLPHYTSHPIVVSEERVNHFMETGFVGWLPPSFLFRESHLERVVKSYVKKIFRLISCSASPPSFLGIHICKQKWERGRGGESFEGSERVLRACSAPAR